MSTTRSKRWNGELDSLTADFLKEVIEKMDSYGDRIQFEMPTKARTPSYQVINARDMKMGFDNRHLLMRLNDTGNVADEMTTTFSLEAIKAALANDGRKPSSRSTGTRSASTSSRSPSKPRTSSSVAPTPVDTIEQDKYAYFKANRDYLPDDIAKHSQEISQLMRGGMSAEQAFEAVIKTHF